MEAHPHAAARRTNGNLHFSQNDTSLTDDISSYPRLCAVEKNGSLPSLTPSSAGPTADEKKSLRGRIEAGANLVDQQFFHDEKRVDVFDLLNAQPGGVCHEDKSHLVLRTHMALPAAIFEQLHQTSNAQQKSLMGLFQEINRAYIAVDNKLFLWNYHNGSEFTFYDEMEQIIVAAALVKPKPGIFVEDIKFVIVIATLNEIVMLGVAFDGNSVYNELTLYPTQFGVSSDNVQMLKIVGTPDGRVFMCGRNGNVYELDYQTSDGCFRKKCRKLNHSKSIIYPYLPSFLFGSTEDPIVDLVVDSTRSPALLYALSKNSVISVYSLGSKHTKQNECTFWAKNDHVWAQCHEKLGQSNMKDSWDQKSFKIVNIHTVTKAESDRANLIATTDRGDRIYFSITSYYGITCFSATYELRVRFVRFLGEKQEHQIHKAYYADGMHLLASSPNHNYETESGSVSFIADHAMISSPPRLSETVDYICDMNEIPASFYMTVEASCLYARGFVQPLSGLNKFATQHVLPPRQFLVLTLSGLYKYAKLRPIDELRNLLSEQVRSADDADIQLFSAKYGTKEACATALAIVSSRMFALDGTIIQQHVQNNIERKDEKHSSESKGSSSSSSSVSRIANSATHVNRYASSKEDDDHIRMRARQAYFRFGTLTSNSNERTTKPQYSGQHDGLALYLARLLRPVWDWTIVVQPEPKTNPKYLRLRFNTEQLRRLLAHLLCLHRFLVLNLDLPERVSNSDPDTERIPKHEFNGIECMRVLLDSCIESFHLLISLAEQEQFPNIVARLVEGEFQKLKNFRFFELVSKKDGDAVARSLISATMNLFGERTDDSRILLVKKLSQHCPTFFGQSDLLQYRAIESLKKAHHHFDVKTERIQHCKDALEAYKDAAADVHFPLKDAVFNLWKLHFYDGAVNLCLHRASIIRELTSSEVVSPEGLTNPMRPSWPRLTEGPLKSSGVLVPTPPMTKIDRYALPKEEEKRCYDYILETLKILIFPSDHALFEERVTTTEKVINQCLEFDNMDFLDILYRWFVQKGLKEHVFKIKSPSIIRFLSSSDEYADILRDYYLRNEMFGPAANLLYQLSHDKSDRYTLVDRLGFLSRAHSCANSSNAERNSLGHSVIDGDFVFRLTERIDIAKIQLKIYCTMKTILEQKERTLCLPEKDEKEQDFILRVRMAVGELDRELFGLDDLYIYSQKFGLWEECLAIIHFSERKDQTKVICALWKNIIRQEIQVCEKSKMDWSSSVRDRFVSLARVYKEVPFMFPLAFLCRELEEYNARMRWSSSPSPNFVMNTLTNAKVSPMALLDVYNQMIESLADWLEDRRDWLFVYLSASNLLEHCAPRASVTISTASLLMINKCKTGLFSMDGAAAKELIVKFNQLETRFR